MSFINYSINCIFSNRTTSARHNYSGGQDKPANCYEKSSLKLVSFQISQYNPSSNFYLIFNMTIGLFLIIFSVGAQTEFDDKLKTLYNNTIVTIQPVEVKILMIRKEKIVLLDTRGKVEYDVSHIQGAKFIEYESYSSNDFKHIPKNARIIVYCSVGYRSERVGEKLLELGYKNVHNIYGGIFEWKNAGFEVVNKFNQPTDSVHTYNKSWAKWLVKGIKVY